MEPYSECFLHMSSVLLDFDAFRFDLHSTGVSQYREFGHESRVGAWQRWSICRRLPVIDSLLVVSSSFYHRRNKENRLFRSSSDRIDGEPTTMDTQSRLTSPRQKACKQLSGHRGFLLGRRIGSEMFRAQWRSSSHQCFIWRRVAFVDAQLDGVHPFVNGHFVTDVETPRDSNTKLPWLSGLEFYSFRTGQTNLLITFDTWHGWV